MATVKRPRTTKTTKKTEAASTPEPRSNETKNNSVTEVTRVTTQTVDIRDAIRTRAYELYVQRGGGHGRDFEDWVRAEAEVMSHFSRSA